MKREIIKTNNAPQAIGPYSQGMKIGDFVFTSGQVYSTPEGKLLEGSIKEQTHQVMKNLESVLEKAGVAFKDVVKTTIYLTDMSLYGEVNEVYASFFSEPYPARETVCVKELPLGARIEISMIASKS